MNGERVEAEFVARLPPVEMFREPLGETEHLILRTMGRTGNGGEGQWTVGDDEYFMMGDNRDNSNDSRYWGMVPDNMVVGKAFAIWMHWQSFTNLPSFDRVGGIN